MSVKIKNLNVTSDKVCTCSDSWLEHWEKKSGKIASLCAALDCSGKAEVGGHVKKAGSEKTHYIVPLCKACNKRTDEFDSFLEIVSADCD